MSKGDWATWHERGTKKKNLSLRRESNPWPPEHQARALSTGLRENSDRAPPCVREVKGSVPVGVSDFFFARFMLINSPFTFHYRARNSSSLSLVMPYPGPTGFSWFFSAWDQRTRATKRRTPIANREVTRKKNWISLSYRRQLSNTSNL